MDIQSKDHRFQGVEERDSHDNEEIGNDLEVGTCDADPPFPLAVSSRLLYMLGDLSSGPGYRLVQWLESVRKRSGRNGSSGFPHRKGLEILSSSEDNFPSSPKDDFQIEQAPEVSLWERLEKAGALDIEANNFSWDSLSSLHHTEHNTERTEDDLNKPLEVTVNSGGVVFFALFNDDISGKETAAVIKFSSSRIATQSERLGYEFARLFRIYTPQARVIHNCSNEWQQIKEATLKAKAKANVEGEMTCTELLEALELSKCLLLMSYVHGSPLLKSSTAFSSTETSSKIASALGRVFLLDLVIRNEDRLPSPQLRWRGNPRNLLLAEKMEFNNVVEFEGAFNSMVKKFPPKIIRVLQKERRAVSVDKKMNSHDISDCFQGSELLDTTDSPKSSEKSYLSQISGESPYSDPGLYVVAIDSGVPRRPPAGKRLNDQENYPKVVELLLNSLDYADNLLHDLTGGNLKDHNSEISLKFRSGFKSALRDLQGFHIFLLTLHQKLDSLLNLFFNIANRITSEDLEREDCPVSESSFTTPIKDRVSHEKTKVSPLSSCKGSGEAERSLMSKLRDILKYAKMDSESSKELELWSETLRSDVISLCQQNSFNTGFFESNDNHCVVDAYELKIRLEHILERVALLSDATNTEKPSQILSNLFIGGALAAKSAHTLRYLGITHILCLCANEIGHSESQNPELFHYKNFSIFDNEEVDISAIFEEASKYIDYATVNGNVLVHCFEGRSRSATMVIAYLMMRRNMKLCEAWEMVKKAHRRAQPNDGFAAALVELDREVHGKASMKWQKRKPEMKTCSLCGKSVGLSSASLKFHLQTVHKKFSSGSVDSAIKVEIQRAIESFKLTQSGTVSPNFDRLSTFHY